MRRYTPSAIVTAAVVSLGLTLGACGSGGAGGSDTVKLRLSHQWPEDDFRAELANRFAEEAAEETGGAVEITVYPNASLIGANEQFEALSTGAIDMSVFPLSYASGQAPEFDITMMPGLVRDHAQARTWPDSPIGERVESLADERGVQILTWVWNSGAFATKGDPIVTPDDIRRGMVMRGAGTSTETVLRAAGAGVSSLPSNEIYSAMQTGVLDGVTTSASSTVSFNLQEQIDSYTAPTDHSIWFIMEPLIISNGAWDKLTPEQQSALESVGNSLQEFAFDASEEDDRQASETLEEAGVEVVEMDAAAFEQWRDLSEQSAWADFAQKVPAGQELLDLALQAGEDQ
ncbi:TRAP transporter substrate-binding protein DctP [Aeromicrobium sp. YIM 150415]|uniref:TRAP transporter substrate-binding protein DctP n=1 Tax=Aeromicrobium sp. YIM 150415 TaxID=2803912 RepID=UPI00196473DF|nr:TRAP transporter substrate-binding protein DctP [Aeromicrobium sp. YIM 150415]MBM9461821.1 TRAP transporter substrate-binding protein DctP [Aeromicrobium sp. YIM 150415]MBM9463169.1 TRAP transporter substrate-binding protein DctP [Aeromicrobium sp. YIM 150415]